MGPSRPRRLGLSKGNPSPPAPSPKEGRNPSWGGNPPPPPTGVGAPGRGGGAPRAGGTAPASSSAGGGRFSTGVPNRVREETGAAAADVVRRAGADVGLAWDGDYDRCFFFDESGQFIEGYYLVGLLAESFLKHEPGARIVHDPRLTWNTLDIVRRHGGTPVLCKSGHAFIKQKMREGEAAYGGGKDADHYFRQFAYCDSGMIPLLLVLAVISERGEPLSALLGERMRVFPASGGINRKVSTHGQGQ